MKSEGLRIVKCSLRFLFTDIKLIVSHAKTVISPKPKIGSRGTRVTNARKQANKASNRVVQTFTVSEPVLTINIIKKWEWLKAFSIFSRFDHAVTFSTFHFYGYHRKRAFWGTRFFFAIKLADPNDVQVTALMVFSGSISNVINRWA